MEYYIDWAEQKPSSNFQTLIIGRSEYKIGTSMWPCGIHLPFMNTTLAHQRMEEEQRIDVDIYCEQQLCSPWYLDW